jgi:hypothetical protein
MLTLTKALLLTVLAAAVTAGSQLSCWGFAAAASAAPASAPAAGSHGVQPQPTTGYHRIILSIIQEFDSGSMFGDALDAAADTGSSSAVQLAAKGSCGKGYSAVGKLCGKQDC